jgi:RNA polymerase sigma-32 factor
MRSTEQSNASSSLSTYLSELQDYPLLTADEEQRLARKYCKGDLASGHALVTANLRFVVKVAYEYRSYGLRMADLIQEGNIGLVKAVQKFDPNKKIRLISYAVWWIRAYVQSHILKSWSLVKLGTTQAQRRLFFSLARARRELEKMSHGDPSLENLANVEELAQRLRVRPEEVREMEQRMGGRDLSLDAPTEEGSETSHLDFLVSHHEAQDEEVARHEESGMIRSRVRGALERLDPRERFIIESRLLNEKKVTLKSLGEHFGFSRERARQLELRAMEKLKQALGELISEVQPEAARIA